MLKVKKRNNTSVYEPLITQAEARRSDVESLMNRAFDGAFGSFVSFLVADEHISERHRAKLLRLLQQAGGEGRPMS